MMVLMLSRVLRCLCGRHGAMTMGATRVVSGCHLIPAAKLVFIVHRTASQISG